MLSADASGVFIIAATPFADDGALDLAGLDRLIDWYEAHGVDGLTILGQLGEAPKLTNSESMAVVKRVLGRSTVPVVVGVSSPGFASMAELADAAMAAGAAGVMVAPPGTLRGDEADPWLLPRGNPALRRNLLDPPGLSARRWATDECIVGPTDRRRLSHSRRPQARGLAGARQDHRHSPPGGRGRPQTVDSLRPWRNSAAARD